MNPPEYHRGYFVAWRTNDFLELLRAKPNAFRLLALIAYRARYHGGYSGDGLGLNECLLGADDVGRALDLSAREYRTAKAVLETAGFATFTATGRGSVARLVDSRVFSASAPTSDSPADRPEDKSATGQRQGDDRAATTNKKEKKDHKDKNQTHFEIPLLLNTERFREAWELWQRHRTEKRQRLTPTSAKLQLDELAGWGEARAIAAIKHSVAKGWLSINESSAPASGKPSVAANHNENSWK